MSFVCWKTEDLDKVLSLEALSGKEELFLATHFPVERLSIRKNSGDFNGSYCNQDELFQGLVRERIHTFCVLEGIAGCGKSHLIRWLAVQWRRHGPSTDVVLLLPRSGHNPGRLVGVLRDELARFGFDNLSSQLTATDDLTPEGRRESFLDRLGTMLDSRNVQQKRAHWEWCDQKRISDVLRSIRVREQWTAPARLIEDHQKEELPLFRREEIWQLVDLAMRGSGLKPVTIAALEKVRAERELLEHHSETERLLTALNDRVRPALRAALGLNERAISEVFSELRRHLYRDGKRLVVLQEDITAAKAIDETLLDLFVSSAGLEGVKECPLVAVCGITPEYEQKYFNQTYGNRVTLHIDMSRFGENIPEPLSVVGTPERRRRFVARYLNGIRWTAQELREQWDEKDLPPSRCSNCSYRDECHQTFGREDGYGLYPFTRFAIERGFEFLTDRDNPSLAKTPRNVLLGLLRPALILKTQIEENRFPGHEVRSDRMKEAVLDLQPDVDSQIRRTANDKYARMRALIGLWGDGGATQTGSIDGEPSYGGVTKRIYEWFGLPWIGDVKSPTQGPTGPSTPPTPPQPPSTVAPPELDKRLAELAAWRKGTVIQSQDWWEEQAWQIVSKIPWSDHGISEWVGRQLLTRERIKLEGGKAGENFLVLPFEAWVREGLQSLVHLKQSSADLARYGPSYLRLVDNIIRIAQNLVRERTASWKDENGKNWSPLRAAIECLAIHAWVSGRVTPVDKLEDQWQEVMSFPMTPDPIPSGRDERWVKLSSDNIGPLQSVHRFLENWTTLLQGTTGRLALEDASEAAEALKSFAESLNLSVQPKDDSLGNLQDLVSLATASKFATKNWTNLVTDETQRIKEQATAIDEQLEKTTLRHAAEELLDALDQSSRVLPSIAAFEARQFAQLHGELSRKEWFNDGSFEEVLDQWSGIPISDQRESLARCIKAPADRIDRVLSMLRFGETALSALENKVNQVLSGNEADGTGTLEAIHKEGEQVQKRVNALTEAIKPLC